MELVTYVANPRNSLNQSNKAGDTYSVSYGQDHVQVSGLEVPGAKVPFYLGSAEDELLIQEAEVDFSERGDLTHFKAKIQAPRGSTEEIRFFQPDINGVQDLLFRDVPRAYEGYVVEFRQGDGDVLQELWIPYEDPNQETLALRQQLGQARRRDEFGDIRSLREAMLAPADGDEKPGRKWMFLGGAVGLLATVALGVGLFLTPGQPEDPLVEGPVVESVVTRESQRTPVEHLIDERFKKSGQATSGTSLTGPGQRQFELIQDQPFLASSGINQSDADRLRDYALQRAGEAIESSDVLTRENTDVAELTRVLYADEVAREAADRVAADPIQEEKLADLYQAATSYIQTRTDYLEQR